MVSKTLAMASRPSPSTYADSVAYLASSIFETWPRSPLAASDQWVANSHMWSSLPSGHSTPTSQPSHSSSGGR
ncbi:hypothetical protein C6575_14790 [Nocardia seriolae]|nr:hypothetical protein C6575_14790 [Nocardia seriolae]